MFKAAFLTTTALLLASGSALAAPHHLKADTNQDGQITQAEFMAAAETRFTETDINGDDSLSKDERKAYRKAQKEKKQDARFTRMDTNGDGVISKAEHDAAANARAERKTERRDMNDDGVVDKADRKAWKEKRKEWRKARKKHKKSRIRHDANSDGVVTRAEHTAASEALFARLDANNDGVLTKGEGRKRKHKRKFRH